MSLEQDAIYEVSNIIEEARTYEIGLPVGVAYQLGIILIITTPVDMEDKRCQITSGIILKLEKVIPPELIESGSENYLGDLSTNVFVPFNQRDVEHIGQAALSLPSGRQIIDALPIDPNDRAELEGFRNRQLRAFLTLYDEFVRIGGRTNSQVKNMIEQELS